MDNKEIIDTPNELHDMQSVEHLIDVFTRDHGLRLSRSQKADLMDALQQVSGELSHATVMDVCRKRIILWTVETFLREQREKPFSRKFKDKIVDRVSRIETFMPEQFVQDVYDKQLDALRARAYSELLSRFSLYRTRRDWAVEIVNSALTNWWKSFDGNRANKGNDPELTYLRACLKTAQSDHFTLERPMDITEVRDRDGNPVADEHGDPWEIEIPVTFYEYKEIGYDRNQEDADATYSDTILDDPEDSLENASKTPLVVDQDFVSDFSSYEDSQPQDIDEVTVQAKATRELSPYGRHSDEELIRFGDRRFAAVAARHISRFYFSAGLADADRQQSLFAAVAGRVKPTLKAVGRLGDPRTANVTSESLRALNRLNVLKTSSDRMWMERAISELRRSKDKLEEEIERRLKTRRNFDPDAFRKSIPVLAAVLVDKNGKFIASTFKGAIDEVVEGRDITWDKHCEYCLFAQILDDDLRERARDGTLYVTLEPCNKRKAYLDNGEPKPKIPCSVRCVEAGLRKVFVGTYDLNPKVKERGCSIMKTAEYEFAVTGNETRAQAQDAALLASYFDKKGYAKKKVNAGLVYSIGRPIIVRPFCFDLKEEVLELNGAFLQYHERPAYHAFE